MTEPILRFEHISKSFFGVPALQDVCLSLEPGKLLGLVGENGAGKSTLMNILGGVIRPDHGRMLLYGRPYNPSNPSEAKRMGIAFIHQELNLFTNLSILDNMFIDGFPRLGGTPFINRRSAANSTKRFLEAVALDVPASTIVERLAPGERQLVEIARALSQDARIIIFDEPTTSLTAKESRRLFEIIEQLRQEGRTVVYISHNLGDVLQLSDSIAVLRDGRVVDTGAAETYTTDKMIARMVGRDVSQLFPQFQSGATRDVVLEAKDLSQRGIIRDISFSLCRGEVLGAFGLMGSGRSELARILFGIDPCRHGAIAVRGLVAKNVSPRKSIEDRIAFVTEDRRAEGLLMEASVQDNVALASLGRYARNGGFVDRRRLAASVARIVESLKIKAGRIESQVAKNLSGGNQQKTVLGKWLLAEPEVLILDEPTRGIDVGAKYEIYCIIKDLAANGTAILCISSELEELMGVCDRIMVMSNGQIQGTFARGEFDQERILQLAFKGREMQANVWISHEGTKAQSKGEDKKIRR